MSDGEPLDLPGARAELAAIVRSLGAQLEWLADSGATGLPRASQELTEHRFSAPLEALSFTLPSQAPDQRPPARALATSAPSHASHVGADAAPARDVFQGSPPRAPAHVSQPGEARVHAVGAPPSPASPTHGSPPDPSATWARDRGESAPLVSRAPLAPLSLEELERRHRQLDVLATQVQSCTRCSLHEQRTQTVFARGTGSSGLCFIGEGPGADEDRLGEPFVGPAGQLLDKMIAGMGLSREEVYVCNIVKCRPPRNRAPTPEEMRACAPYLAEQLRLIAPRVIVALGATAMEGLFGHSLGITRIRGRWRVYQEHIHVMPTFHPAYLLRNPRAKREVWEDLKAVMRLLTASHPGGQ